VNPFKPQVKVEPLGAKRVSYWKISLECLIGRQKEQMYSSAYKTNKLE